jgi:DNA mismatch endonuclease, patch repair protein
MADTRTPDQRRRIMQSVKTENTGPEWAVRRLLYRLRYRYRLHPENLPGRPDIVFRSRKAAIFVNGCFWHSHGCSKGRPPKSRLEYWGPKLQANQRRDATKAEELRALGWRILTVWQCEVQDAKKLTPKLIKFIERPKPVGKRIG